MSSFKVDSLETYWFDRGHLVFMQKSSMLRIWTVFEISNFYSDFRKHFPFRFFFKDISETIGYIAGTPCLFSGLVGSIASGQLSNFLFCENISSVICALIRSTRITWAVCRWWAEGRCSSSLWSQADAQLRLRLQTNEILMVHLNYSFKKLQLYTIDWSFWNFVPGKKQKYHQHLALTSPETAFPLL